jgi:hypothetical protein
MCVNSSFEDEPKLNKQNEENKNELVATNPWAKPFVTYDLRERLSTAQGMPTQKISGRNQIDETCHNSMRPKFTRPGVKSSILLGDERHHKFIKPKPYISSDSERGINFYSPTRK